MAVPPNRDSEFDPAPPEDMQTILTPRLRIRPLTRGDLRPLHMMYGDAELMRFITGRPRTPFETRSRLKKDLGFHRDYGFGLCLVESRETGEAIGRCGLEPRPDGDVLTGELAWMFVQSWWGKGLATEAGTAIIDWAEAELDLARIFARAYPDNAASVRVMAKLGMHRCGLIDGEIEYERRQSEGRRTLS